MVTALVVVLTASACGGTRRAGTQIAPAAVTTTTVASPTTALATTTTHPPTSVPPVEPTTSTDAPTTVAAVPETVSDNPVSDNPIADLPQPIAPPGDGAVEPEIGVGRIEIPKLGIDMAMFEGITLATLDKGPGHWPGTAMPGQAGNVVIAGHRVSHTHPFRHIDQLEAGDQVVFTVGGQRFAYEVTNHEIVTPNRVDIVNQTAEPTATLFACHPPGSTQYRWVTHLKLVTA